MISLTRKKLEAALNKYDARILRIHQFFVAIANERADIKLRKFQELIPDHPN